MHGIEWPPSPTPHAYNKIPALLSPPQKVRRHRKGRTETHGCWLERACESSSMSKTQQQRYPYHFLAYVILYFGDLWSHLTPSIRGRDKNAIHDFSPHKCAANGCTGAKGSVCLSRNSADTPWVWGCSLHKESSMGLRTVLVPGFKVQYAMRLLGKCRLLQTCKCLWNPIIAEDRRIRIPS